MLLNPHAYCKLNNRLEANFREVYHSLKFPSKHPMPLVANLSATRIYDSRYGWGRLWRWFYQIAHWITGNSWHQEKLKTAILNTNTLFHNEIAKLQNPLRKYLEYLEKCGKGYYVDEDKYFSARNIITKWNASTQPFLKIAEKELFANLLCEPSKLTIAVPLFQSSISKLLQTCQKIIDLEGFMGGPLPLSILKKIIREKPLNTLDQKDLDKWIYKINKLELEVKAVHKALEAINDVYHKESEQLSKHGRLTTLELYLEDKGCKVFQKKEPKHIKWRHSLEPGTPFLLEHSEIILGTEIYPQSSVSDQTRAYQIEGQSDRIAIIAQNRIALSLRDLRMQKQNNFSIPPALLLDISSDGKIAVLERLKPLNTVQWSNIEGKTTPDDDVILNSLSAIIQSFIKRSITPSKFDPQYVMFNEQLQLKALKPSSIGPFDFNAIEDFILECASGNLTIFQELMLKSGLISHPIAKFYRDIILNALQGDSTAPDDLAGIYRINDPKVVDRAALLTNNIKPIKNQLILRLRELGPKLSPQQIENKVNRLLLKEYLEHKTAGILWPTLLDNVASRLNGTKSLPDEKNNK